MLEFYMMPNADAVDRAMRQDREFFENHPEESDYCRLAIPGEDFGYFPPQTFVHVTNFGEGIRFRAIYVPPEGLWRGLEERHNTRR